MRPFKFLPAPITADNGGYDTFIKSASSQAGLQALIHRQGDPTMASYTARRTHPPIFSALSRKASPYGAVAILARQIAHSEPIDPKLNDEIDQLLKRGKYQEPNYYPDRPEIKCEYRTDADPRDCGSGSDQACVPCQEFYSPWQIEPEDLWGSPEGYNE